MQLRTPAARVKQGDLVVYLISVKVEQLIADGCYDVERLDPETDEGYQRLLNKARAKRLADHVVDGQESNDGQCAGRAAPRVIGRAGGLLASLS